MLVKVVKLSICPCNKDNVLGSWIKVGTEFEIYPDTISHGGLYHCGFCHRNIRNIVTVMAAQRCEGFAPAQLPLALFDYQTN